MANLQYSGAISINDIKALFGGPASPSLSNYYRGGSYIPTGKTVYYTAREPSSGSTYNTNTKWTFSRYGFYDVYWGGTNVGSGYGSVTSLTVGGVTYYRDALKASSGGNNEYSVYRTYGSSYWQNINTGIPSSGQISLSQFYGAEKP